MGQALTRVTDGFPTILILVHGLSASIVHRIHRRASGTVCRGGMDLQSRQPTSCRTGPTEVDSPRSKRVEARLGLPLSTRFGECRWHRVSVGKTCDPFGWAAGILLEVVL